MWTCSSSICLRIDLVRRAVLNQVRHANANLPLVAVAHRVADPVAEKPGELGTSLLLPALVGRYEFWQKSFGRSEGEGYLTAVNRPGGTTSSKTRQGT